MKEGLLSWLLQRITGVVLVAGLAVHFSVMHFSGPEQITHDFFVKRMANPYWRIFDLLFLLSVIYHGFNGLWGMALEYVSSARVLRLSGYLILSSAFLLVAVGVYILTV